MNVEYGCSQMTLLDNYKLSLVTTWTTLYVISDKKCHDLKLNICTYTFMNIFVNLIGNKNIMHSTSNTYLIETVKVTFS